MYLGVLDVLILEKVPSVQIFEVSFEFSVFIL